MVEANDGFGFWLFVFSLIMLTNCVTAIYFVRVTSEIPLINENLAEELKDCRIELNNYGELTRAYEHGCIVTGYYDCRNLKVAKYQLTAEKYIGALYGEVNIKGNYSHFQETVLTPKEPECCKVCENEN